jgi:cell shape-determining protein MreD
MNWPVIALAIYLSLGIDLGARAALTIGGSAAPSLLAALVALIAAFAPATAALWVALLAGALVDLTTPVATTEGPTLVLGPSALGFVVGAYVVVTLRTLFARRHATALVVLAVLAAGAAGLVAAGLLALRQVTDSGFTLAGPQVLGRIGSALYTAVPAMGLALVWRRVMPVLGLVDPFARRWDRGG